MKPPIFENKMVSYDHNRNDIFLGDNDEEKDHTDENKVFRHTLLKMNVQPLIDGKIKRLLVISGHVSLEKKSLLLSTKKMT